MKAMISLCLAMSLTACGGGSGGGPAPPPPPPPPPPWPPGIPLLPIWEPPECAAVSGPPVATVSSDGGITLRPNAEPISFGEDERTQSIVSIQHDGGRVFASRGPDVFMSTDAGCTWELVFEAPEPLRLIAPGYPWYAYGIGDRGDAIYMFGDPGLGVRFDLPFHAIDIASSRGTAYALTSDGGIMRMQFSTDQVEWDLIGNAPVNSDPDSLTVNPLSSPFDPTHIVLTMANGPPMVTFDDGANWTESTGILDNANSVTTGRVRFSMTFPPATQSEVWIFVTRQRTDPDSGNPFEERAIARSTDGGVTFTDVIIDDGVAVLLEDAPMATPWNRGGEVVFSFGSCPDNEPRLYHYRAEDDSLTVIDWEPNEIHGIESIQFQPLHSSFSEPDLLFIGHKAIDSCP